MIDKSDIQRALARRIGSSIATVRRSTGWTQSDLAERIGVETETVSRFERGATLPSLVTLQKLAVVLNTTMGDLIGESSPMPNDQAQAISAWLTPLSVDDRGMLLDMVKMLATRLQRG